MVNSGAEESLACSAKPGELETHAGYYFPVILQVFHTLHIDGERCPLHPPVGLESELVAVKTVGLLLCRCPFGGDYTIA
jgi:hypothetical protein